MSHPVSEHSAFDLKSGAWTLTVLRLHTADADAVAATLAERSAGNPGLFDREPVVLDLAALAAGNAAIDFAALLARLRDEGLLPVAVQGGSALQMEAAFAAGLAEASARLPRARAAAAEAPPSASAARPPVDEAAQAPAPFSPTLVVDGPLRSGQRVYARGGDLVVLSLVSHGAEVIADGSIHVYGPLRGRAIAGACGDTGARIFSTAMDPQLVSIAGIYRTTEVALSDEVLGQAAQVRLEGERLVVEPLRG
ncbi:MAG TPA: septum site-determining protein MinC [Rhodocyclaceae bacterium]|nr:septum site-determining protein MinC [Rhodocyclaceae bacterium]HMZ00130.1 septum site-determining protein MinC [Burkholderiaceae bacterium]